MLRRAVQSAVARISGRPPPPARKPSAGPSEPAPQRPPLTDKQKIQYGIWAVGVSVLVISGTIYGAGLKERQQHEAKLRKMRETTLDQRIEMLHEYRADLVRQSGEIEAKIARLRETIAARDAEDEGEGEKKFESGKGMANKGVAGWGR
ncbi:hypothetical protein C8A05DRAFT_30650 [Staphylotrichum tortipilum]|uniref:Uncharacterized protein n=1 Tax=Staphylotrichum tortipilum TaxID=2831512 RepID=A0AAN6MSC9_9PEZI|nr:hypothetical protein C8A05DRAFT_30650 [Staphylotrichum longicolle]